jgi:hypothetical protein
MLPAAARRMAIPIAWRPSMVSMNVELKTAALVPPSFGREALGR